jgi:hypothetical protein
MCDPVNLGSNYMYQLLLKPVTLNFVFMDFCVIINANMDYLLEQY